MLRPQSYEQNYSMAEVDLLNRDPNELNGHIKASFEDVLSEPDGVKSVECIWLNSYACFSGGRNCCYSLLTMLCGLCIALYWGCIFACIAFDQIWCCTPLLRVTDINCKTMQKFYSLCCNCWLGPCCESLGLFFSKIHVTNQSG